MSKEKITMVALRPLHLDLAGDGTVTAIARGEKFDLPDHFDEARVSGLALRADSDEAKDTQFSGYEMQTPRSATEIIAEEDEARKKIKPEDDESFKKIAATEDIVRTRNDAAIAAASAESAAAFRAEAERKLADAKASNDKSAIATQKAVVDEFKANEKVAVADAKAADKAADKAAESQG